MAIYTGVADANGDFTVPFSSSYSSGQKVTVTAEKDSATKSIELYAPANASGGGIYFTGSFADFPNNIEKMVLSDEVTSIPNYCFTGASSTAQDGFFGKIKELQMLGAISRIGSNAFRHWRSLKSIEFPSPAVAPSIYLSTYCFSNCALESITLGSNINVDSGSTYIFSSNSSATVIEIPDHWALIPNYAFQGCSAVIEFVIPDSVLSVGQAALSGLLGCKKMTIGLSVNAIANAGMQNLSSCDELIVLPLTPPSIQSNSLIGLNVNCVIKVPSASLSTYQSAVNWAAFSMQMIGI